MTTLENSSGKEIWNEILEKDNRRELFGFGRPEISGLSLYMSMGINKLP